MAWGEFTASITGEWRTELAVKTAHKAFFENQQQRENFTRECYTWIDLGLHPNIVSCYFVRQLGGVPRVFAEYIDGGTLREWIDSRRLYAGGRDEALARIIDIAIQMAWGLHYAHEKGVIHQDVKPGNVLMTTGGTARIADFGLAKARMFTAQQTDGGQYHTILSSIGGMTPAYCSPEQAAGRLLTRRTDCWSWAVSVLEMFTGGVVWQTGLAGPEALAACLASPEDRPVSRLPTSLSEFLKQCFLRDPQDRPRQMADCAKALMRIFAAMIGRNFERGEPQPVQLTAGALNNRAVSLLEVGKSDEAEAAWNEALKFDPHHVESTYNQGLRLWRTGRLLDDELLLRLRQLEISHPQDALLARLTAEVQLERGDNNAALEKFRELSRRGVESLGNQVAFERARDDEAATGCVRVFEGHTDRIVCVYLTADGRFAVSSSKDGTIRVWDAQTGKCVRIFDGWSTICLRLNAQGLFGLNARSDSIELWNVASAERLQVFEGHKLNINRVSFGRSGQCMLSASDDMALLLWDVKTGRCLRVLKGHSKPVTSVFLSADDTFAVSGSSDGSVRLWDVATGECVRVFEGHSDPVNFVCLSNDGRLVLSSSSGQFRDEGDHSLRLWDVTSGRCLRVLRDTSRFSSGATAVVLSDDNRLAIAAYGLTLRVWQLATGRCVRTLTGHRPISSGDISLSMSPGSRLILSGAADKTLRLWKIGAFDYPAPAALSEISFEKAEAAHFRYAAAMEQARKALSDSAATKAARALREIRNQPGYEREPTAFELWQRLYISLPKKSFRKAWIHKVLVGHDKAVVSVCISRDAKLAVSGSEDSTVRMWNVATGECIRVLKTLSARPVLCARSLSLSADSRLLLFAGAYDKTFQVWDAGTGRCLQVIQGHDSRVNSACLSDDGRFAVSTGQDHRIVLWEVATGRLLRVIEECRPLQRVSLCDGPASICLSADGRFVLSSGRFIEESDPSAGGHIIGRGIDNYPIKTLEPLRLWEIATGICVREFYSHTSPVEVVSLSPDMRFALSADKKNTLRLWDVSTGSLLRAFNDDLPITSICWSEDSRFALTAGGCISVWEVATGRLFHTARALPHSESAVCMSLDGGIAISASTDKTLKLWSLDWELDDKEPANWDEGARPYLRNFLTLHTPYAAPLPEGDQPDEDALTLALTRRGKPAWTENDFQELLYTLGCAGYGWLRPDGVRRELESMARRA